MKVIFLDIDGVLNTSRNTANEVRVEENSMDKISREKIALLNTLIEDTGAKVVISSTWRKLYTQIELEEIFKNFGFVGEIIGMTPCSSHGFRGLEIRQWHYGRKDIENYIILDDDSDMLLWQASHFFNTDHEYGLTKKIVYKATRFLNGII